MMSAKKTFGRIMDCKSDIVIRAGAGTGKTRALVDKYLSELMGRVDDGYVGVDRLAAITFTEKAASEMSDRAREALTRRIEALGREERIHGSSANIARDDPEWSDNAKLLAHLVRQRQALSSACISTIHSFCARLLYENPFSAGVDPFFTVLDSAQASAMLDNVTGKVILERLRVGDQGVRGLILDYGFSSGGYYTGGLKDYMVWLIPLIRAENIQPGKLETMNREMVKSLETERIGAPEKLRTIIPQLMSCRKNSKEYKTAILINQYPEIFDDHADMPPSVAGKLLKAGHDLETTASKRKSVKEGDGGHETAFEAARLIALACGPALERELLKSARALTGLLEKIMEVYNQAKERKTALDFDDLEEKARDLLLNSPEILETYRKRFVRVLIDEFQDTNQLQRQIVELIAPPGDGRLFVVGDVKQSIYGFRGADVGVFEQMAGKIADGGGEEFTLNTSRRATPGLVDFINRFFTALMDGHGDGQGIVRFNPATDSLLCEREQADDQPCVEMITISAKKASVKTVRVIEAQVIAQRIERMVSEKFMVDDSSTGERRPAGYGDVAILLKTFSGHRVYELALRRAGIPLQIVKGKGFYSAQEIKDIAGLLSFIDNSADTLSLFSVLRSPLVGLSDPALLALCRDADGSRRRDPSGFILKGETTPDSLSEEDTWRLKLFRRNARRWIQARDRVMISELMEMILSDTGYGAVMISRDNGEQLLANIHKLIEMARAFEADSAHGLKNFCARLRTTINTRSAEAQADISGGDWQVASVMTVHQSKGLEFPIVFLADLGASPKPATASLAFHASVGLGLGYHDHSSAIKYPGPIFKMARQAEKSAGESELKRLLYVAMTRARDRLVLLTPENGRGVWAKWVNEMAGAQPGMKLETIAAPSARPCDDFHEPEPPLARKLIAGFRPDIRVEDQPAPQGAPSRPALQVSVTDLATFGQCPRLYYYRRVMGLGGLDAKPASADQGSGESSSAITGSQVHHLLETMPLGKGAPADALGKLASGELADWPPQAIENFVERTQKIFRIPPLASLANTPPEAIMREVPLALKLEGKNADMVIHGVADIVWFDGKEWNLVDYKYSTRPQNEMSYLLQLKLYGYTIMTAHAMDSLNSAVVYLIEAPDQAVSGMRLLPMDTADLRRRFVTMAERLAGLEGKPEKEWPMIDKGLCIARTCAFHETCHGEERG